MKTKEKPYFTQYCNAMFEWKSLNKDISDLTEEESAMFSELRKKSALQNGMTENEIDLIYSCRKHRIFQRVNTFAHKLRECYS